MANPSTTPPLCQPPPHTTSPPAAWDGLAGPAVPAIRILLLNAAERPSLAASGLIFSSFVSTPLTHQRVSRHREDLALGGQLFSIWNKFFILFQETQRKLCPRMCGVGAGVWEVRRERCVCLCA